MSGTTTLPAKCNIYNLPPLQPGTGATIPLPVTLDVNQVECAMNWTNLSNEEYQGYLTVLNANDITPVSAQAGGPSSVTDANGDVWTLPMMTPANTYYGIAWPAGALTRNGQQIKISTSVNGDFVDSIRVVNGQLWAQMAKGFRWYQWNGTTVVTWNQPDPGVPTTMPVGTVTPQAPATAPSSSAYVYVPPFRMSNGFVVDNAGIKFVANGICVLDTTVGTVVANSNCTPLLANFPGCNFVRIICKSGYTATINDTTIINAINWLTALGIVVVLCNYNATNSLGANDPTMISWFTQLATKWKSNPLVWFNTMSAPQNGTGQVSDEHQAVYNAIRGAGNAAPIGLDPIGGYSPTGLINDGRYKSWTNVFWNMHYYNGRTSYSTDYTTNLNQLVSDIASILAFTALPVIVGEFGNSTATVNADAGGTQAVQVVLDYAPTHFNGYAAYIYYIPGNQAAAHMGNMLTQQSNGALTAYGTQIKTGTASVTTAPTGAWSVSGGRVLRGGQPFTIYGVAVLDGMMSSVPASLVKQLFPNCNAINLAVGADGNGYASAQPDAAIFAWVDDAIAKGFVVMLSDYVPGQPQVRSGTDLTNSCAWYTRMATHYAQQPMVIWTTENEVYNSGNCHQAIYNAIRGAGNNSLIFFESENGNYNGFNSINAAIYSTWTNVGWNIHMYPWAFGSAATMQDYYNNIHSWINQWQNYAHSADGVMPVLMGEGGNSTSGASVPSDDKIINGKYACVQAFIDLTTNQPSNFCGAFPWLWSWYGYVPPAGAGGNTDADTLVNTNGNTKTPYGNQCAAFTGATMSTPSPGGGGGTGAPSQPPDQLITAVTTGATVIYDAQLNAWTLVNLNDGNGFRIAVNGTVDMSTRNIVQLYYHNHTVYQQANSTDSLGNNPGWWAWQNNAWNGSVGSPIPAQSESPEGTTLVDAGGIILASRTPGTASSGPFDTWSLTGANGNIIYNGTVQGSATTTLELYYHNHTVYQQTASGWNVWNGTAVVPASDPRITTSANGASITGPGDVLYDQNVTPWTLVASATQGNQIQHGGTTDTSTQNVNLLLWYNNQIHQRNTSGGWWVWATGTSVPTTFNDDFTATEPWLTHRAWTAGDNFGFCTPATPDGRGGPNNNESGSQWWTNPNNPSTPIAGLYSISGGQMHLGVLPTPAAYQNYINLQAGTNLPFVGTLLHTVNSFTQQYGYWAVSAAVDTTPGISFQWCLEAWEIYHWPPEIDIRVDSNSNGQVVNFGVAQSTGGELWSSIPFDASGQHEYAIEWTNTLINFYLDGVLKWTVQLSSLPDPADYTSTPQYMYILTATNYGADVTPNPAQLTSGGGTGSPGGWMNHLAFGGNEFYLPWVNEQQYYADNGSGHVSSYGYNAFAISNSVLSIIARTAPSVPIGAGAKWYVDNSVATSGAGTSWAGAWKNLSNIVWASVAAGDTIYISGGAASQTYNETLTIGKSGTSGNSIIITAGTDAGHNGTVIIDGQSAGRDCLDIISRSYIGVYNLTLQNPGSGFDCVWINGNSGVMNGVVVQGCKVHVGGTNNNGHSCAFDIRNITGAGSSGILISSNYVDTADSGGANGASFTDQTDGIYIQGNTVDDAILVDGNTIIMRNSNSNGHNDGIQTVNNGNLTIRNNYIEQIYDGTNLHGMMLSDPVNGKILTAYNNTIRIKGGAGPVAVICQNTTNTTTSTNGIFHFYNNTLDVSGWAFSMGSPNAASEFKNNIIACSGASSFAFVTNGWTPTAVGQIDYNDVYLTNGAAFSSGATTGWNPNGQSGNPNFINASSYPANNYALGAGSAALNHGLTIPVVTTDATGLGRPQGTAYDIGAFEGSGAPVSVINPAGQPWNSGCITSCREINGGPEPGLYAFNHGYCEGRIQMPKGGPANGGPGTWGALVLYPLSVHTGGTVTYPPGELDVVELLGGSPGVVRQSIHSGVAGASHENDYTGVADVSLAFHTYGVELTGSTITFWFDNVQTYQQAMPSDIAANLWYINCVLAIGGPTSWSGAPAVTTPTTTNVMQVDYIGVWASRAAAYSGTGGTLNKSAAQFLDDFAGTTIPSATPGIGSITDINGAVWTVTSAGVVQKNGANAGFSSNVTRIVYVNNVIWQTNAAGNWYYWTEPNIWTQGSDPTAATASNITFDGAQSVAGGNGSGAHIDYIRAYAARPAGAGTGTYHWVGEAGDPRLASQTVTDILLDNQTVTAGSPASTVVGNIVVVTSSGQFTGTFGALGGSNAANFKIVNSQLQTAGALTAGTNSVSITAQLTNGSTVTKSFTIQIAPATATGSVALTSVIKGFSRYNFGLSTGALADNKFAALANSSVVSSLAQIRPTLLRINADQYIARNFGTDNTVMNAWWANATSFMDPSYRLIMGVGPLTGQEVLSPSQWASLVGTFAQAEKTAGHEIIYWSVGNEWPSDVDTYSAYFNAIADTLHGINAAYKVGATEGLSWNAPDIAAFLVDSAGKVDFFCFHSYPVAPADTNAQIYAKAIGFTDVASVRAKLVNTAAADIPIMMTEYNGNAAQNSGAFGLPWQGTYVGAVYNALLLSAAHKSDFNFTGAAMWDALYDDYYGAVGNKQLASDPTKIDPAGYYLGKAGQVMSGNQVSASTSLTSVDILFTVNAKAFAAQIVNYDVAAAKTLNLSVLGGAISGTVARWEIGKANPTTPLIGTQASMSSIALPSEQIVLLTGALA